MPKIVTGKIELIKPWCLHLAGKEVKQEAKIQ
jgi:hypothetical protein